MNFLLIDGTLVPVAIAAPADMEYQDVGGEVVPAYAGNLLSSVKARRRVWRVATTPLETVPAVLRTMAPVTCAGRYIGGSVSCLIRSLRERAVATAYGTRWVVEFELHEVAP